MSTRVKLFLGLAFIVVFVLGFASGMEYEAYKVRETISKAFNNISPQPASTITMDQAKQQTMVTINKNIGDEVVLATENIKVNSSTEQQTISSQYGTPKVAKNGTKFVIINLDITNTTKSEFTFAPDDVFVLIDNQKREYQTYNDSIGSIDNYLNYASLSPSVTETGVLVYEVPTNATSYNLVTSKEGTKDLYEIKLK